MALSSKAQGGQLVVSTISTCRRQDQELREKLGALGFGKTALVIDGDALNVASPALVEPASINLMPGGRRQRLRHHAPRDAGPDPRRGREAGGRFNG
jgi:hypothetical protein